MALVHRVEESGPWAQLYGYSRAVAVGPLVVTGACTADVDGMPALIDDPGAQAKEAFRTALDAMLHAGASVADVVRSRLYVTDPSHADPVGRVHGEFFGVVKPAATVVTVARLLHPGQLVAVELEAFRAWRDLRLASVAMAARLTARKRRRGRETRCRQASPRPRCTTSRAVRPRHIDR